MSIRSKYHSHVDEFISDLASYASGDYLRKEEKDLWEQPFDPAAVEQVDKVLRDLIDRIDNLGAHPSAQPVFAEMRVSIDKLLKINSAHHDAVLDIEEQEELNNMFADISRDLGLEDLEDDKMPEFAC